MSDDTRDPSAGNLAERAYYLIGGSLTSHLRAFFQKVRQARRSHTTAADYQSMRGLYEAWKHHTPPNKREEILLKAKEAKAAYLGGDESQLDNGLYCFIEFFKIREQFVGGEKRREYDSRRWRNVKANPSVHAKVKAAATERQRQSRTRLREARAGDNS
jgi:hypothetical protein